MPVANPYQTPATTGSNYRETTPSNRIRTVDVIAWLLPLPLMSTVIVATWTLRASSKSITAMQYKEYHQSASANLQIAYDAALMAIALSPLLFVFSIAAQLGFHGVESRTRLTRVAITLACWFAALIVLTLLNIPVVDYIAD